MRTITNDTLKITYPESIFETRGLFSYIKVELIIPSENETIILTLTCGDKNINLVRKTSKDGVVVFPIGRISESLISGNESNSVNFSISFSGISYPGYLMYAITGFANREIYTGWAIDEKPTTLYPASDCIVVYPNAGFKQYLFFPAITSELFVLTASSNTTNEYIGHSYNSPYC